MATRRTGTVSAVNDAIDNLSESELATWQAPIGEQIEQMEQPEETAADRVARMLGSVSNDERTKVGLYKIMPNKKLAWAADYTVEAFEAEYLELIRRDWGPGDYEIRLYGIKPGTKYFVVRVRENITVLPLRDEANIPSQRQNSELAQALQMMAQTQQQILTALTEKPPAVDPMAQMSQMFGMMATMREAMGSPPQNQLKDIVGAMREMKEVSAEFAPKESSASDDPMSMLAPILGIVQASIAAKNGGQAAQQENQSQENQSQENPQQIEFNNAPRPQGLALANRKLPQHSNEGEDMDMGTLALFGQFKRLLVLAKSGAAPQTGADLLFEKLPDELIDLLESPEWFGLLEKLPMGIGADAIRHRDWLTQARDLAVAMFNEPESDADGNASTVDGSPAT
jgi:hypothetical protein